ncbi:hypothetical protein [Bacillus massiliigorillae]|uniref:hypothetical protein n=1 Tax=Bacillus massiliigorillae TaxID=1243664 RepID=UPI0003A02B62|nr:hypothetical protein [Bacillus massiliigorillae]
MTMIAKIITLNPIQNEDIALKFSSLLTKAGLTPEKIGTVEPLTKNYSQHDFLKMWTEEDETYENVEIDHMVGTAGGILGKVNDPHFLFIVDWMKSSKNINLNYVTFFFPVETFLQYREVIMTVFKDTILLVDGIYGYISHEVPAERQHIPGTLETRLPGVFWCNYYGEHYVDYFSEDKVITFPWNETEKLENGGLVTYLTNLPNHELLHSEDLEVLAKQHLGAASLTEVLKSKNSSYMTLKQ